MWKYSRSEESATNCIVHYKIIARHPNEKDKVAFNKHDII